jgi:ribosomal protein S3
VSAGYLPKAGEPARLVRIASITAYPKSGAIGVVVKIVPPGTVFPDKKQVKKVELPRVISAAEVPDLALGEGPRKKIGGTGDAEAEGKKPAKKADE